MGGWWMCAMNDVDDDVVSLAGWLVGWVGCGDIHIFRFSSAAVRNHNCETTINHRQGRRRKEGWLTDWLVFHSPASVINLHWEEVIQSFGALTVVQGCLSWPNDDDDWILINRNKLFFPWTDERINNAAHTIFFKWEKCVWILPTASVTVRRNGRHLPDPIPCGVCRFLLNPINSPQVAA